MAKYRPIDVRLWNDQKFLSLSDDGRMLWLFLLTTTSTLPIPGVVVGGPAALSEQLGWPVERFREGFAELLSRGLSVRADFDARLVWLTKAIKRWPPQNPNMVKGWSETWEDVPECPMKHEIWQALRESCERWPEPFAEGFPEPSVNGSGMGMPNQEQEQEQEEEMSGKPDVPALVLVPLTTKPDPVTETAAAVIGELNRLTGAAFSPTSIPVVRNLKALLGRRHKAETMLQVVRFKVAEWRGTDYAKYLRPTTLLRPGKFEEYLVELEGKHGRGARSTPSAPRTPEDDLEYRAQFLPDRSDEEVA